MLTGSQKSQCFNLTFDFSQLVAIRALLGEGTVVEVCGIGTADIHP